ncbi:MAG: peptide ABC transporter substrate-binding protein [Planctomycetota bacterium]|nr:peptide ABC transporter substrate-binding protein [Planctomycetota bacterium]
MRSLEFAILVLITLSVPILAIWSLPSLPGPADLVIANGTDPGSIHPHRATGLPEGRIIRAIHEGLVLLDPQSLQPIPGCAERWEISADGTRYRFHIQPGLLWSDGTRLTAEDFRRSWLDLLDPLQGAPYGDLLDSVIGAKGWRQLKSSRDQVAIRTEGDAMLVIELEQPVPWFLFLCAQTPLQPVHPQADGRAGIDIATNGPWIIESWRLRDRIRLIPNPYYRGPSTPNLEVIDFLAVESGNTQLNLLAAGMADWSVRTPAAAIPVLRKDPKWASMWRADPYLGISFYRLNLERPPLDDGTVRRAISLVLDRQQLCRDVLGGDPEPALGLIPWPAPAIERQRAKMKGRRPSVQIPDLLPGYRGMAMTNQPQAAVIPATEISPEQWPVAGYDPQLARQILQQAGWRVPGSSDGRPIPPIEILHPSGGTHSLVAEWLQMVWKRELGIETTIQSMEWRSFLDVQRSVDYHVSYSSWIADYPDPATFLTLFTSGAPNSRTGWSDAEYDQRVISALAEPRVDVRMKIWQQAEKILLERGPVLPLWSMTSGNLVSDRVEGFLANPLDQHDLRALDRSPR